MTNGLIIFLALFLFLYSCRFDLAHNKPYREATASDVVVELRKKCFIFFYT